MRLTGLFMLIAGLIASLLYPYLHGLYLSGEASGGVQWTGYTLIAIGLIAYVFGGRRRAERDSNAPTGTQSRAAQIGRRIDPEAPAEASKMKWGRGNE